MPIAVNEYNNMNLSSQHITTSNFMEFTVAKCMELVPKQKISVTHDVFTRLEPMLVPTFGVADVHNKAYFVPFRTVMPGWNDFINDVQHVYPDGTAAHITQVHTILNKNFVRFLRNDVCSTLIDGFNTVTGVADFVVYTASNEIFGYRLTPYGRRVFKILTSLGYKFNFNERDVDFETLQFSALPLLCVLKVYIDWYYPSQYSQDELWFNLEWLTKQDTTTPFYRNVGESQLHQIFDVITRVCYDSDYFVSSWDNPSGPNDSSYSTVQINDASLGYAQGSTSGPSVTNSSNDGTPIARSIGNSLSQYMINALKSLSDYCKRHQLSGARVLDRYLSRWGVVLDSAKLDRSIEISRYNREITFGDVTATADTEGANLGAYAGKGLANSRGDFEYQTDEYGMMIIITTIIPRNSYYQGRDRMTQHLTKYDFFTPEFDSLGVQALATSELFMPYDARQQYENFTPVDEPFSGETQVFSFVPRYAEYKVSKDMITGDYVLGSRNKGKDSWTLFRDVSPYFKERGMSAKHNLTFVEGLDSDQYNRIFYYTGNEADHFNVSHLFGIKTLFPGKKLYDTYEFETDGTAPEILMDNGGVKSN